MPKVQFNPNTLKVIYNSATEKVQTTEPEDCYCSACNCGPQTIEVTLQDMTDGPCIAFLNDTHILPAIEESEVCRWLLGFGAPCGTLCHIGVAVWENPAGTFNQTLTVNCTIPATDLFTADTAIYGVDGCIGQTFTNNEAVGGTGVTVF